MGLINKISEEGIDESLDVGEIDSKIFGMCSTEAKKYIGRLSSKKRFELFSYTLNRFASHVKGEKDIFLKYDLEH